MKRTLSKFLFIGAISLIPTLSFAGGCERDGFEHPAFDKQECEMMGGEWFTCTKDGQELEFVRDRWMCEMERGVWSSGPSAPSIVSPIPTLNNSYDDGKEIIFKDKLVFQGKYKDNLGLYITDGTDEGTTLIKNFKDIKNFIVFGDKIIFSANDGTSGVELWITDGTVDGTKLLKDIYSGSNSSYPNYFTEFENKIYFSASVNATGYELWVTDGTTNGTKLLKDMIPGSSSSSPRNFYKALGKLFFSAYAFEAGLELWSTDGTTNGTKLVKDIYPGLADSYPKFILENNEKLYFKGKDSLGYRLFVTDGTDTGTIGLTPGDFHLNDLFKINNKLYFHNKNALWTTDGTVEGTKEFKVITSTDNNAYTGDIYEVNNKAFFKTDDDVHGSEIWTSDGTAEGTKLFKDLNPGEHGSSSNFFTLFDNKLYFSAGINDVWSLYKIDGIANEPEQIFLNEGKYIRDLFENNGKLYFYSENNLYVSDGTTKGTKLIFQSDIRFDKTFLGDKKFYQKDREGKNLISIDSVNETYNKLVHKSYVYEKETIKPFARLDISYTQEDNIKAIISLSDNIKGVLSKSQIVFSDISYLQSELRNIEFTANNSSEGSVIATISLENTTSLKSEYQHEIIIKKAINNEPIITIANSLETLVNKSKNLSFTYTDKDLDIVTAVQKTGPTNGSISINEQTITYTPNNNYIGNDSFILTLSDGSGFSVDKTILVSIKNSAPSEVTISSSNIVSQVGDSIIGQLSSQDDDLRDLTYSIVSGNDGGFFSIDSQNNLIINDAKSNITSGTHTLVIKVSDGISETLTTITFNVVEPLTFNYQGFLSKAGQAVNADLEMTFKLYDSVDSNIESWSTTKTVTVKDGIYNVVIGLNEDKTLNSLDMLNKNYYMGITIGSNSEMTPRQLFKPNGYIELLRQKVQALESKLK